MINYSNMTGLWEDDKCMRQYTFLELELTFRNHADFI